VGASIAEGLVGVAMHVFHEKAVNRKLKFTSTYDFCDVVVHWVGVIRKVRRYPPAPLGDGRGEAPGRGFGGDPKRGRAGVRSAGFGAAAPSCLLEPGNSGFRLPYALIAATVKSH
jgi:hypothetical protein